ncbi:hypothetical protein JZ751_010635, partial [Albula glossodonta]
YRCKPKLWCISATYCRGISNLLLQSLQESFSLTHCSLLLISDQLFHLRAPSLNGADQLSKDPLTVLHCCLCRITDTLLIGTTVNLQQFLMLRADLLLQASCGFNQFVRLPSIEFIMKNQITFTVRGQTHQTGLDGFVFPPSADITHNVSRSGVTVSRRSSLESCLLQFLHHISQYGVSAQNRPWGEGLSALGTAVDTSMIILTPVMLNTANTITVSTGNSHRILQ